MGNYASDPYLYKGEGATIVITVNKLNFVYKGGNFTRLSARPPTPYIGGLFE